MSTLPNERMLYVALDKPNYVDVLVALAGLPRIGFKVGSVVALRYGLGTVVGNIHKICSGARVCYDHQKAANDIPDLGDDFADVLQDTGVDSAILFPFAGPATQSQWTKSCQAAGLEVMVGAVMTHPKFLVSEGGHIADDIADQVFPQAINEGVTHFIAPGNKVAWVKRIRAMCTARLGPGNFQISAPGLITQKGDISECGLAAGPRFNAIVGRDITMRETVEDMRAAALRCIQALG